MSRFVSFHFISFRFSQSLWYCSTVWVLYVHFSFRFSRIRICTLWVFSLFTIFIFTDNDFLMKCALFRYFCILFSLFFFCSLSIVQTAMASGIGKYHEKNNIVWILNMHREWNCLNNNRMVVSVVNYIAPSTEYRVPHDLCMNLMCYYGW